MILGLHLIFGIGLFVLGTVIGSFLNVCIYRMPWEKSLIWPASRCGQCFEPVSASDNVPVLSWFALGGRCRHCGASFSARYAMVELLVGVLFLAVYVVDIGHGASLLYQTPATAGIRLVYHLILVSLLVVAAFIDIDFTIIPDEITVTGMVLGLAMGTLWPEIRPAPAWANTHWGGLWMGLKGLLVGGGMIWAIRIVGGLAAGREAMGFGDVTLMAMIGAFMGWQATLLTLVAGAFLGLVPALAKLVVLAGKRLLGRKSRAVEHEIPFGPFLALGAIVLMLAWKWFWPAWGEAYFLQASLAIVTLWQLATGQPVTVPGVEPLP